MSHWLLATGLAPFAAAPIANCKTERKAGDKNGDFARNFENNWLG